MSLSTNDANQKKKISIKKSNRFIPKIMLAAAFAVPLALFVFFRLLPESSQQQGSVESLWDEPATVQSKYAKAKAQDGIVSFAADIFGDMRARHYYYQHGDTSIKFFLVQAEDGVVRAAFDACDVCFPAKRGYSQAGNTMVCNNCSQRFGLERINIEYGGCNPAPLERVASGNQIRITTAALEAGRRFF